ncbi:hypothetical protein EPA93_46945 [Ktedonosporobacter rubrisoli]|uniref:Glucose-6-phosphate isomerase n=1 Tax=Ktedonosporobacter rubrisoli TaxID=2509675 RepID=A0A4P6K4I3_KTERU|nr:hypothetical protein [Ktedonosporobacter rubrisoli]QBD83104.1 hypothetical protein EPA93_46945 [Ktedonosporobacter rubrisoli]
MTRGNGSMLRSLQRLASEDSIGQLRRQEGTMAILGSEGGGLKLDWVEGIARLLTDETSLEMVEDEARELWQRGIRHIIWAGMGGSVITVRVLDTLGFCAGEHGKHIAIYPLDSTDPAALNAIIQKIAVAKQLTVPQEPDPSFVRQLLADVMVIGVSMGMTSEEPITHLTWFSQLLEFAQLTPAEHILVMTLPGSYLNQFALERQAPSLPLQLDGQAGTGGRMSAPTTRVFLLPAALYLTRLSSTNGQLRQVLSAAWHLYNLEQASNAPAEHPFVQLGAALYEHSQNGACRLLLQMPKQWSALHIWIEQLMEESLGKGDKGVVAFTEQALNEQGSNFSSGDMLHVHMAATASAEADFALTLPYLQTQNSQQRLAALAASFLGWQLSMAVYGYLQGITFAGQPAVENYKARARALRDLADPLQAAKNWPATITAQGLTLLMPAELSAQDTPATAFVTTLRQHKNSALGYLDLTLNGVFPEPLEQLIAHHLYTIGNSLLGVPVKLRHAPADYHSTEQSEMDGPPYLVSLRLLLRDHEQSLLGSYSDAFLRAQALSTWQAMIEQKRSCFLLILPGSMEQVSETLQRFFTEVADLLTTR